MGSNWLVYLRVVEPSNQTRSNTEKPTDVIAHSTLEHHQAGGHSYAFLPYVAAVNTQSPDPGGGRDPKGRISAAPNPKSKVIVHHWSTTSYATTQTKVTPAAIAMEVVPVSFPFHTRNNEKEEELCNRLLQISAYPATFA